MNHCECARCPCCGKLVVQQSSPQQQIPYRGQYPGGWWGIIPPDNYTTAQLITTDSTDTLKFT